MASAGKTHAPTMPHLYRPSGGYYRRALRSARTYSQLLELALSLVRETEFLRTWARANGLTPPHFEVTTAEAVATQADVVEISAAVSRSRVLPDGPQIELSERQCL